jgi:hypothetical protein
LLAPTCAWAEVSDKIPSALQIWAVAGLASAGVVMLSRWRLAALAFAIAMAVGLGALLAELHANDLAPAIMQESGPGYFLQAYAATAAFALACGLAWRLNRRRPRT